MVEYGCKGSGCVRGRFVSPADISAPDKNGIRYTPAGYPVLNPADIAKAGLKPGDKGYIEGIQPYGYEGCKNPNGCTCVNTECFGRDNLGNPTYINAYITKITGYTRGHTNIPLQIAGVFYTPMIIYGDNGSSGGNGAGGPTVIWVTATPTPTPTPTAVPGPWVRLKDASFYKEARIESYIPASPVPYDADDTADPYFIIGDGGAVLASSIALKGLNNNAKANFHDWQDGNYDKLPGRMTPSEYIEYVKGRKEYKNINNLNQIDGDGIYYYESLDALNITSVPSSFNLYNVVLLSNTPVNIQITDDFFKPQKSIAIVSPIINFASNVKEAKGLFISLAADTGTTENQGLKIVGNLIAHDAFTYDRKWSNLNRPSLFVVFDPKQYLDLLPYLSVVNYNWQQQQ